MYKRQKLTGFKYLFSLHGFNLTFILHLLCFIMCFKQQVWLSAVACWFCLAGLYLCSGVDLCEVVRVGTHHCAGCCVLKAAELSRGSSSGPMQTGICTLRCHSGLLQLRCWSRSGTPAGNDGELVFPLIIINFISQFCDIIDDILDWLAFVFVVIMLQETTAKRTI